MTGILFIVIYSAQRHFTKSHSDESQANECHSAESHAHECYYTKLHLSDCRFAKCHSAKCHSDDYLMPFCQVSFYSMQLTVCLNAMLV